MRRFPQIAVAVAVALGVAYGVTFPVRGTVEASANPAKDATVVVNRSSKQNRLSSHKSTAQDAPGVALVEVIGLRGAAVVYRSRDGRELFRTDPLRNTTIVAKGRALPEVTIRDSETSAVRIFPAPAASTPAGSPAPAVAKEKLPAMPEGCDPAFSPLAGSPAANYNGRCLAANGLGEKSAFAARDGS
ncbi:MAG TPA: hypothetical protein VFA53_11070 [Xanthobacteraceae bacterium]|nr:hypothetical protein [Xanthobacteraceae bacterium]